MLQRAEYRNFLRGGDRSGRRRADLCFRAERKQRIVDTGSEFCRAHIFGNGIDGVEHPAIPREGG